MKRLLGAILAMGVLAGCEPPMTAVSDDVAEGIAQDLGPSRQVIPSGVYQIISFEVDGEVTLASEATEQETTPDLPEFFAVQYAPRFGTYAAATGAMAFYDFDGELFVVAMEFPDFDGVAYLLAEVSDGGNAIEILFYNCGTIPQNYRLSQGIEVEDCAVTSASTVLRGLGLMDASALGRMRLERYSELPDYRY